MGNCKSVVDIIKEAFKKPLKFWSIVIVTLLILDLSLFIYIVNFGKGGVTKNLAEINKDKTYLYSSIINTNDTVNFLLIIQTLLFMRYFKKKYSNKTELLGNKQQITTGYFLSLFLFVLLICSFRSVSNFTGLYCISYTFDCNIFMNVFMASLASYIVAAYTIFLAIFLSENVAAILSLAILYFGAREQSIIQLADNNLWPGILSCMKDIFVPNLYLIQQAASNELLIKKFFYPEVIIVIIYSIGYIAVLITATLLLDFYRMRAKNLNV